MPHMKTCLICDDHAMMSEALAGTVHLRWPDAQVKQVGDYPSAWAAVATSCFDLIVSDLVMPGATPVEGIRRLRAAAPDTPILIVTGNEDDDVLLELFDLGISGFAPKTSKGALIEAAIGVVLAGGRYIPPQIVEIAARRNGATGDAMSIPFPVRRHLTERQRDVLSLIAAGQSNKEIARELDLSPATIKAHAAAANAALGATNRSEAVIKARDMGLI